MVMIDRMFIQEEKVALNTDRILAKERPGELHFFCLCDWKKQSECRYLGPYRGANGRALVYDVADPSSILAWVLSYLMKTDKGLKSSQKYFEKLLYSTYDAQVILYSFIFIFLNHGGYSGWARLAPHVWTCMPLGAQVWVWPGSSCPNSAPTSLSHWFPVIISTLLSSIKAQKTNLKKYFF